MYCSLCVCVRACLRACVPACVRACVRACVCVLFLFLFYDFYYHFISLHCEKLVCKLERFSEWLNFFNFFKSSIRVHAGIMS